VAGEDLEQLELAPRRLERAAAAGRDVAARVDDEVADDVRGGRVAAAPA
jgi:hypothetical protein